MKRLILLIVSFFILTSTVEAQNSAISYYRKIANERKKIKKKRMKYLQISLKENDPRKLEKYRSMVVDQLDASSKAIQKMKPFKGDSAFRNDYVRTFKLYQQAYTSSYGNMKALEDSAKNSYESMMTYLDAVEMMEDEIALAAEKLNRNEEYFANKYRFEIVVDEELERQYEELNDVIYYTRDMYRAYFRVEDQIRQFLQVSVDNDLEIRDLRRRQQEILKSIKKAKEEVELVGVFDEDELHYGDVLDLMDNLDVMCSEELSEVLDLLDEGSYDERMWDKGVKKFKNFVEDLDGYISDYYESKNLFVEDYLPEDFDN